MAIITQVPFQSNHFYIHYTFSDILSILYRTVPYEVHIYICTESHKITHTDSHITAAYTCICCASRWQHGVQQGRTEGTRGNNTTNTFRIFSHPHPFSRRAGFPGALMVIRSWTTVTSTFCAPGVLYKLTGNWQPNSTDRNVWTAKRNEQAHSQTEDSKQEGMKTDCSIQWETRQTLLLCCRHSRLLTEGWLKQTHDQMTNHGGWHYKAWRKRSSPFNSQSPSPSSFTANFMLLDFLMWNRGWLGESVDSSTEMSEEVFDGVVSTFGYDLRYRSLYCSVLEDGREDKHLITHQTSDHIHYKHLISPTTYIINPITYLITATQTSDHPNHTNATPTSTLFSQTYMIT